MSSRSQFCKALIAGLMAAATALPCLGVDGQPSFVKEGLYVANAAPVAEVLAGEKSDLVVIEGGLSQGLRRGMICCIERNNRLVAEVLIIASHPNRAAALILQIARETTIQPGDIARIKTFQNS
ncbi:MAG: Uncharacterised protein [Opitutia bacterium UBA7350]|nr:MAG: Uncharacterised protein [Opitutae bacterium UBA7350]